jgi:hypothetical protein
VALTEKDPFLAILSMDSYNRGAGSGIRHNGDDDRDGLGVSNASIGGATVINIELPFGSLPAGFSATAYSLGTGANTEIVISYRGTNFSPSDQFRPDVANGWASGIGDFRASQVELATQFLSTVIANTEGKITLTGHSGLHPSGETHLIQ